MIDLHNHILPAVDDGAADVAESVAIAHQFVAEGARTIVATPHLDPLNGRGPEAAAVRELTVMVQREVREAGLALEILPGHEIFLTPEVPRLLAEGVALPLAGRKFVLVELSLTAAERPLFLDDVLFQLQLSGYHPILAHPERYAFVQRAPEVLDPLVAHEVVMQLTAPCLFGYYGPRVRKTAERLLRRGIYRLAASDRHHPDQPRSLHHLHAAISRLAAPAVADLLLVANPGRVVAGLDPEAPPEVPAARRRWLRPFSPPRQTP